MTKKDLAQMLAFYAEDNKKHHFLYMSPTRNPRLTEGENMKLVVEFAACAAGTKIIEGKVEWGKQYLVTRGEVLGFGKKPDVTCEYSRHWPWDFCYMYKL